MTWGDFEIRSEKSTPLPPGSPGRLFQTFPPETPSLRSQPPCYESPSHMERLHGGAPIDGVQSVNRFSPDTGHESEETSSWFQPQGEFLSEAPDITEQTIHPFCVLSKSLTHTICEHNKMAVVLFY